MRPPAAEPAEVQSGSLTILNLRCSHIFSDEVTPIEKWDFVNGHISEGTAMKPNRRDEESNIYSALRNNSCAGYARALYSAETP